jgi:hypothetical protein
MKKLFTSLCLFMAIITVYAQNFVPNPNKQYNIVQTSSNLVVGPTQVGGISTTQPAVVTLANLKSQAFSFVPVSGKTDTYYLLNAEGNYLNKVNAASLSWDTWDVVFETTTAALSSEWVISGTDSTAIRLMCNFNSKYLASDGVVDGSGLYCDKAVDNANGLYQLKVATIDLTPKFNLSESLVLQVESMQPYPIWFTAANQTYNINATASAGFSVNQSTFTPTDFANGGGKASLYVNATTAAIGDSGKVIFSYTLAGVTHKIDSAKIVLVPDYPRFFIMNKDTSLVVGSDSIMDPYPVLIPKAVGDPDPTQNFIFRPVNPGVTDSLYYMIQDATYQMMRKDASSNYNTQYGFSSDEAKWKITPLTDGSNKIVNFVINSTPANAAFCLGTDGITYLSRLYDNKTFSAATTPATAPHCEWTFMSLSATGFTHTALNQHLYANVANQYVNVHGTLAGDNVKVYNVSGQLVKQVIANSNITSLNLGSGVYIIKVNASVMKVIK